MTENLDDLRTATGSQPVISAKLDHPHNTPLGGGVGDDAHELEVAMLRNSHGLLLDQILFGPPGHVKKFPISDFDAIIVPGNEPSICPSTDRPIKAIWLPTILKVFERVGLVKPGLTIHWVGSQANFENVCTCFLPNNKTTEPQKKSPSPFPYGTGLHWLWGWGKRISDHLSGEHRTSRHERGYFMPDSQASKGMRELSLVCPMAAQTIQAATAETEIAFNRFLTNPSPGNEESYWESAEWLMNQVFGACDTWSTTLADKKGKAKTTRKKTKGGRGGHNSKEIQIISALDLHHDRNGYVCHNLEPIDSKRLAVNAGVSISAVSIFLKKHFGNDPVGGVEGYRVACASEKIGIVLASLCGDLPTGVLKNILYRSSSRSDLIEDENAIDPADLED